MWILLALAALARPSPEALDDIDRWHAGADRLLDGPRGCWILEGEARQVFRVHQSADRFSLPSKTELEASGPFIGRIEDGLWTRIDFQRTYSDPRREVVVDLKPLVGRTPKSEGAEQGEVSLSVGSDGAQMAGSVAESMSLLRAAVERWTGSVETRYARWDEPSKTVQYLRHVAVSEGSNDTVEVVSSFPQGGELATRVDAVWPRRLKLGSWPLRATLRDPQMHVLGFVHDGDVLPNAESVSLVVGVLGFTVGYEQHLTYGAAAPCPAGAQAGDDLVGPPVPDDSAPEDPPAADDAAPEGASGDDEVAPQ